MLYALGDPVSFLLLVIAFVVCAVVAGWLSALACSRLGLRELRAERRTRPDPRRQVDPFGAVGAAVSGIGWARPIDPGLRRGAGVALALVAGPLVVLGAGLGALAAYGATAGGLPGVSAVVLQRGLSADLAERAWLLGGLMATYVGALSLVPLPPLPGGHALLAVAPRTIGWQKARYQLVDRGIGTAVVLALLLIPLGGATALLPAVLDSVLSPLVRLVTGAV